MDDETTWTLPTSGDVPADQHVGVLAALKTLKEGGLTLRMSEVQGLACPTIGLDRRDENEQLEFAPVFVFVTPELWDVIKPLPKEDDDQL